MPILPRKRGKDEPFGQRKPLMPPEAIERLKEERVKELMSLSIDDIAMIDAIAAGAKDPITGKPIRNASTILRAIEMKLKHTVSTPRQDVGVEGGISITIKTLADMPEDEVKKEEDVE
jgi:hypothetical protein